LTTRFSGPNILVRGVAVVDPGSRAGMWKKSSTARALKGYPCRSSDPAGGVSEVMLLPSDLPQQGPGVRTPGMSDPGLSARRRRPAGLAAGFTCLKRAERDPTMSQNEQQPLKLDPMTLIAQLRVMREQIPDYTQLPIPARQSIRVVAATNPEFVRASINGVAESPNVQQALGRTPEDLRQETDEAQGWRDVEDEVRALLAGVAASNLVRRNRIGETALAAYAIARRLARQKQHANLLPHVDTMKRLNKFGVKRAKPVTPAPAPEL